MANDVDALIKLINLSNDEITVAVHDEFGSAISPAYNDKPILSKSRDINFIVLLGRKYEILINGEVVRRGMMCSIVPGYNRTSDGKHAILTWDGKQIGSYKGVQTGPYLNHTNDCDCSGCTIGYAPTKYVPYNEWK